MIGSSVATPPRNKKSILNVASNTAVVGQNDHLSDSTYYGSPESEPDIETGL